MQRNTFSVFHRLPTELHITIFQCVASAEATCPIGCLLSLSTVAVRWWEVIREAAPLWAFIRSMDDLPRLALQRSKGLPLEVAFDSPGTWFDGFLFKDLHMLDARESSAHQVCNSSWRWRSLQLKSSKFTLARSIVNLLREGPLPLLEVLDLACSSGANPYGTRQTPCILGEMPRLRILRLSRALISWAEAPVSGLEILTLENLVVDDAMWLPGLIKALDLCKALKELQLKSIGLKFPLPNHLLDPNKPPPLSLPKLKTLIILHVPPFICVQLVPAISSSALSRFRMNWIRPAIPTAFVDPPLIPRRGGQSLLHTTIANSRARSLYISLSRDTICVQGGGDAFELGDPKVNVKYRWTGSKTTDLVLSHPIYIPVTLHADRLTEPDCINEFLRGLSTLTTLIVEPSAAWVADVLRDRSSLACVQLKEVIFEGDIPDKIIDKIRSMVPFLEEQTPGIQVYGLPPVH